MIALKPKLFKNKLLLIPGIVGENLGKTITYKNNKFTVVPWSIENFMLLQRLGIKNLPSPSEGYDFSKSLYSPYGHQRATVDYFLANAKAFCWNDAGTGKTASCLWAYDILRRQDKAKKILILAPLSTVNNVWGTEFFKLLTVIKYEVLIGSRASRLKKLAKNLDVYVINHDGIKVLLPELVKWQPDLIIVDEHTAFKNKSASRWKALNKLSAKSKRIWMLSGTPAPLSPLDLFAPARIICPDLVGRSMARFRDLVMYQVSMYKWVPRDNFESILKEIIKPVIRFTRDECLDLPTVTYQLFDMPFSAKQQKVYSELKKDAITQIDAGLITAVHEGVMRGKLLQCSAGYVYATASPETEASVGVPVESKITIDLDPKPRLAALYDLILESSRGVIIFASYKNAIKAVTSFLQKSFVTRSITGETSSKDRDVYFKKFQKGEIKVLVAHPKTIGHGVTLTKADTVIWYLVTSDCELYEQANSRINRIGQGNTMRVIHLVSSQLEREVLHRLKYKKSMQGLLLETLGGQDESEKS